MAFIFAVSTKPMPEGAPLFWQADKLFHFIAYFVMGVLWVRAIKAARPSTTAGEGIAISAIISFLFGIFMEVCQYFVPERSAEVLDAVANGAGAAAGSLIYVSSCFKKRIVS